MTEEEARKKWCPYMNIDGYRGDENCIASDCMMWRWVRNDYAEGYQPQVGHEEYDKGYCGLGGKL